MIYSQSHPIIVCVLTFVLQPVNTIRKIGGIWDWLKRIPYNLISRKFKEFRANLLSIFFICGQIRGGMECINNDAMNVFEQVS
jgi:hypothetical protein